MDNLEIVATFGMQNTGRRQTKEKTQQKKLKSWTASTPSWTEGRAQVLAKGNQLLLLINLFHMIIKIRSQIWIHYCYQFERCKTSTTEHNKRVAVFLITIKFSLIHVQWVLWLTWYFFSELTQRKKTMDDLSSKKI